MHGGKSQGPPKGNSRALKQGRCTTEKQKKLGAARGIRTPDPIITNDVLYQLSYCGMREEARA
jgi:hypothetical protein